LRPEFIETTLDSIEDMNMQMSCLKDGEACDGQVLASIRRNTHSIKSQAKTFGFPLVGRIAHLLEDYLAELSRFDSAAAEDVCLFLLRMSEPLISGSNPSPREALAVLRSLPIFRTEIDAR
jgi:chemotaxis protein histidine kinase CheA